MWDCEAKHMLAEISTRNGQVDREKCLVLWAGTPAKWKVANPNPLFIKKVTDDRKQKVGVALEIMEERWSINFALVLKTHLFDEKRWTIFRWPKQSRRFESVSAYFLTEWDKFISEMKIHQKCFQWTFPKNVWYAVEIYQKHWLG